MAYDKGDRMRLTASLTARERRRMAATLGNDQEAVETAEGARDRRMAEYWAKGLPLGAIQGATGLGYETVRKALIAQGLDVDPK